jgi:hypothetical protein
MKIFHRFFTRKGEGRLRLFEKKVLRRIFGPKWEKVAGC